MVSVFSDVSKFECLGSGNKFDNTTQTETKLNVVFFSLLKVMTSQNGF